MLTNGYIGNRDTIESKIMSTLYDKINIVVEFNSLYRLCGEATWSDFESMLNYFYEARNKILGCNFGNPMVKIKYQDKLFSFSVSSLLKKYYVYVWDEKGTASICSLPVHAEILKSELDEINSYLEEFCQDKIRCSCCRKLMDKKDVAGRYFAGVYCKECWESEYKAREAAETYD